MTETVDSVFGSDDGRVPATIPTEIFDGLKAMRVEFNLEADQVMNDYVAQLNQPKITAMGQARWIVAFRALRASLQRSYIKATGHLFEFMPADIGGKPTAAKNGGFNIRAFGMIRSIDPALEFEGPATVRFGGLPDEATATNYATNLEIGSVYKIPANPSNQSPSGKIANGAVGFLFSDVAGTPEKVASPDSAFWNGAFDRLLASFPVTALAEILQTPKPNQTYHIAGEILYGRLSVNPTTNAQNGTIRLMDDSVTGELSKASGGGLFLFLPKEHTHIAGLPVGSRIEALIDGYFRPDKTANNENTGGGRWVYNVHILKPVIDLTPGTEIPNADRTAVNIPEKAPVKTRL